MEDKFLDYIPLFSGLPEEDRKKLKLKRDIPFL
jgi:hypothetical protein